MEKANLSYLDKLCEGNEDFRKKLVNIIKKEFPEELEMYRAAMQNVELKIAAQLVHKIKHKIGIFSLEQGYTIAQEHERFLNDCDTRKAEEFETVLHSLEQFIASI